MPEALVSEGRRCWRCGTEYAADTVICVRCGIDLRTGETVGTDADEEEKAPAPMRALLFIGELVPGLFRPVLLIVALLTAGVGLGVMWFSLLFLSWGGVLTACAVGAGGLIIYAQAVALVLNGSFCLLHEALAELDGRRWLLFFLLLSVPFVILFTVIGHAYPEE